MVLIDRYVRPKSLEEAYELLTSVKGARIIGGFTFMRLGTVNIPLLIDLQDLGLDFIREGEDFMEIGATVKLGDVERSEVIQKHFDGFLSKTVKYIWSVQLRNIATVGGTVFARFGFSDFITSLLVLNTKVKLYRNGEMLLEDFLESRVSRDILVSLKIEKEERKAKFRFMRNSFYDFSILNVAVSAKVENGRLGGFRIAIGARPGIAKLAKKAMEYLEKNGLSPETISKASDLSAEEMEFGTDIRGDAEYRKMICPVLVRRALNDILSESSGGNRS